MTALEEYEQEKRRNEESGVDFLNSDRADAAIEELKAEVESAENRWEAIQALYEETVGLLRKAEAEVERLREGYEKLPSMIESIMVSCNGFQPAFEDGTSVTYRVLVAVKTHAADLVRRWRDE